MASAFAEDQNFLDLIGAEGLAAIRAAANRVRYQAGSFVHHRGDHRPGLSIVLEGRVQIGNLTEDGAQLVTLECGAGHTFGEITSFVPIARTHDVIALEDTTILQVSASALQRLLQSEPRIGSGLLQVFAGRLHLALEILEDFRANAPTGRLASALLRRTRMVPEGGCVQVTQSALAYEIGVSRVTLGKLLKDFEARGLLLRDYGKLHILDRHALERFRERTG